MFKQFRKKLITLAIESHTIRGMVLRGDRVEKWGSVVLAPGMVKNDLILQPKAVGGAIRGLLDTMKARRGDVVVSLSGMGSVHRLLTLPRMEPALVEEAIQRATKSEIPVPLEHLYLSWRPVRDESGERESCVVGVPRDLVDAEVKSLAEGAVRPQIMWLKPLALARLVNLREALIVDLEPGVFTIVLVANGVPSIIRTATPRGEAAAPDDSIRRLTEEILKTIEFHNQGHPDSPLSVDTPAFLTGELSDDAGVIRLMNNGIDNPVYLLQPPVKCPPDMPVAPYAVNIGLAMAKMPVAAKGEKLRDVSLNVLPEKYRPRGLPVKTALFSLATVLALAGLFPVFQFKERNDAETARLSGELTAVVQELRQSRTAMNEEKALSDDVARIETAVSALRTEHRTILDRRGDYTGALEIVTALLPSGVRLRSVALTAGQVALEGEANSPAAAVSYAKAFEKEGTFPKVSITMLSDTAFSITAGR